jgi:hypothetical protein
MIAQETRSFLLFGYERPLGLGPRLPMNVLSGEFTSFRVIRILEHD